MYKTKNDQSKYTQTWAGTLDFSDKSEINQTYNIQTQKLIHECKQITVIGIFIKKKKKKTLLQNNNFDNSWLPTIIIFRIKHIIFIKERAHAGGLTFRRTLKKDFCNCQYC